VTDTLDVKHDNFVLGDYRKFYQRLADHHMQKIQARQVGKSYGLRDNSFSVYHIPTLLYSYPLAAKMLKRLGYKNFDYGADIGVGTVSFFDFFQVKHKITVDLIMDYCKFIKYPAACADAEVLPIQSNIFDLVVYSDIFEHVLSFKKAIAEAYRILVKGGVMVVVVPWEQELTRPLSDFGHIRRFGEDNYQKRFRGFHVLAMEQTEKEAGWLDQIVLIMERK